MRESWISIRNKGQAAEMGQIKGCQRDWSVPSQTVIEHHIGGEIILSATNPSQPNNKKTITMVPQYIK